MRSYCLNSIAERQETVTKTIEANTPMLLAYWHGGANRGIGLGDLPAFIDTVNLYQLTIDPLTTLDTSMIGGDGIAWQSTLQEAARLRREGRRVVATLASPAAGDYSWNAIGDPDAFAENVRRLIVDEWDLDGIDIDPIMGRYGKPGERFIDVVDALSRYFGPRSSSGRTLSFLSYDLMLDRDLLGASRGAFDHISLMGYFWPLTEMIDQFEQYAEVVGSDRLLFGVSPENPPTPLEDVRALCRWQPHDGGKRGIMEFNINGDACFTCANTIHRHMTP